jgi:hypothetical protein
MREEFRGVFGRNTEGFVIPEFRSCQARIGVLCVKHNAGLIVTIHKNIHVWQNVCELPVVVSAAGTRTIPLSNQLTFAIRSLHSLSKYVLSFGAETFPSVIAIFVRPSGRESGIT